MEVRTLDYSDDGGNVVAEAVVYVGDEAFVITEFEGDIEPTVYEVEVTERMPIHHIRPHEKLK